MSRTAITSWRRASCATSRSRPAPPAKSDTKNTIERRRRTWPAKSSAGRKLVFTPTASKAKQSRTIRRTWPIPFLAGTYFSTRSLNAINPTLSLLRIAERAMQAQKSAAE
jgi:hypothetical protein